MQGRSISPGNTIVLDEAFFGAEDEQDWLDEKRGVRTPDRLRKPHLLAWRKRVSEALTSKGKALTTRSVNKRVQSVKGFLRFLASRGYVPAALEEALEYAKEPKVLPSSVLTHAQVRKVLDAIPTGTPEGFRNRTMLEVLYSSGVRSAELLGLDLGHVDWRNATARVTGKGNKERVVPIGRTAMRYLETLQHYARLTITDLKRTHAKCHPRERADC